MANLFWFCWKRSPCFSLVCLWSQMIKGNGSPQCLLGINWKFSAQLKNAKRTDLTSQQAVFFCFLHLHFDLVRVDLLFGPCERIEFWWCLRFSDASHIHIRQSSHPSLNPTNASLKQMLECWKVLKSIFFDSVFRESCFQCDCSPIGLRFFTDVYDVVGHWAKSFRQASADVLLLERKKNILGVTFSRKNDFTRTRTTVMERENQREEITFH